MNKLNLWDFSCRLYQYQDTAELLLTLQEQSGININELLAFIWAGTSRLLLTDSDIDMMCNQASFLKRVINICRFCRRKAKGSALYPRLKKLELALEKKHLAHLESALINKTIESDAQWGTNIDYYLSKFDGDKVLGHKLKQNIHNWLNTLLK